MGDDDENIERPDEEPVDPLVVLRAEIDQGIAIAPELARLAAGLYQAFLGEGFTEQQALYLVSRQIRQHHD